MVERKPHLTRALVLVLALVPRSSVYAADPPPPACVRTLSGPIPALINGAASQCLVLDVLQGACSPLTPETEVRMESPAVPGKVLTGKVVERCAPWKDGLQVLVRDVPADLPATASNWSVTADDVEFEFAAPAFPHIRFGAITAAYKSTLGMSASANGVVKDTEDAGGRHLVLDPVVTPENPKEWGIANSVELSLPPNHDTGSTQTRGATLYRLDWCAQSKGGASYVVDDKGEPYGVSAAGFGKGHYQFADSKEARERRGDAAFGFVRNRSVRIVVPRSLTDGSPIRMQVFAVMRAGGSDTDDENAVCKSGGTRVVEAGTLDVAPRSLLESVPLPFRERLTLQCGEYSARTGGAVAPMDTDVWTCRLCYRPVGVSTDACEQGTSYDDLVAKRTRLDSEGVAPESPRRRPVEREYLSRYKLKYYGPQTIRISLVDQDGKPVRDDVAWTLHPEDYNELPLSLGDAKRTEIVVKATLSAKQEQARFRDNTVQKDNGVVQESNSNFSYTAAVRPRGPFGWKLPIRFFVTASITPVGLRFPARSKELHRSSESSKISLAPAVASLLLVVEPWKWVQRQNALGGFNLRVGTGLLMYQAESKDLTPSVLAGASFALPLTETTPGSQLGTSIALWAFYERDLATSRNYALITLSVDVLTLFSGNTGVSK